MAISNTGMIIISVTTVGCVLLLGLVLFTILVTRRWRTVPYGRTYGLSSFHARAPDVYDSAIPDHHRSISASTSTQSTLHPTLAASTDTRRSMDWTTVDLDNRNRRNIPSTRFFYGSVTAVESGAEHTLATCVMPSPQLPTPIVEQPASTRIPIRSSFVGEFQLPSMNERVSPSTVTLDTAIPSRQDAWPLKQTPVGVSSGTGLERNPALGLRAVVDVEAMTSSGEPVRQ